MCPYSPKEPQRISPIFVLLEMIGKEFELYDESAEPLDPDEFCYPEIGMFDSSEEYYAELLHARKALGLPIQFDYADFVEPDFMTKFAKDPAKAIKESRIWPMLINEVGLEDAEATVYSLSTEFEPEPD